MNIAFSKPTRDADGQRALFAGFRDAGYAGLQLKGGQYSAYLDDPAQFRQQWGEDPALTSALITMGGLDPAGVADLRRIIDFAVATGAQRVVFCHAHPREGVSDEDIAGFARIMSDIGKESADRGVALSLHHHYQQPVMHRHDFDVFFDAADSVGLTVDTAHLVKSGVTDVAGLIRDLGPAIDNLHLKDFAAGEFRLLGEGTLDFDAIFQALRAIDYNGWLCVDEESSASLADGLRISQEFLRTHLT